MNLNRAEQKRLGIREFHSDLSAWDGVGLAIPCRSKEERSLHQATHRAGSQPKRQRLSVRKRQYKEHTERRTVEKVQQLAG